MTQNQYKVSRDETQHGPAGEHHLIQGANSSMRLWHHEQPADSAEKKLSRHDYEILGYVITGSVELTVGGQTLTLTQGDSYAVPKGAEHVFHVLTPLTAVEVTTPATNR